ncbi:MAG: DUF327 family protein [Spirochaetes bacterium]|nr:DUF327 family protein [Spirochaetota bacterium]
MEILPANQRKEEKTTVKGKKKAHEVKGRSLFASELQQTVVQEFQGSIEELMNDLRDQEKRFLDAQNVYELNRYRSLVQKILRQILQEGFTTKTLNRTRKDRANFTIVSEINDKLEAISQAIVRSNKAFNLLATIDEIRGLVFDLIY